MATKKIGAYITLDGEKEFRAATSACNKSLSTMKSEMKLVEAQTTGTANTLETLQKKHDVLSRTLDEQVKKEEAVRTGLKHAEEQYAKVGSELDAYKSKLEQARSNLEEMKQSSETTEEALNKQSEQVEQLEKIVSKGEETYQRAGNRVNDWKKQLNNAEAQTIKATKALNENAAYMREAEDATDNCAKSIDGFGNKVDDTVKKLTGFGTTLKMNVQNTLIETGKELGKDLFQNAVQGTLELQDAQNQLRASTGATAEATKEYSTEMQAAYKSGYADSVNDVAQAMALVKQYTDETDPSKIREMAESGMALEDTFGMDLSESIRGVDALMENMGLTSEEAFDYMARGAQNGLDKSGELADNLAEYSQIWAQAGFSAGEMFTILENGLDSGAYNLDKVNDYVKEFGNSLADGRIEQNLSSFSDNTQNLFYQWKAGEATTKQVFQSVISDLASMENQQQALTIASNTWSSLGEDNAMKVITSLNNVNNTYKNVQGTMEEIKNIKYDSVSNQWKVLGRTFQTDIMQPILVKFLPVAQKGMEVLADNIDTIVPAATAAGAAVGTIWAVNKSKKFIEDTKSAISIIGKAKDSVLKFVGVRTTETVADTASTAAKGANTAATVAQTTATTAQAAATTAATAAQSAFTTVLMANPMVLAAAGIVALTAAVVAFGGEVDNTKSKSEELKEEAEDLKNKVVEATSGLSESIAETESSLSEVMASGDVANGLVEELQSLASQSRLTADEQSRMKIIVQELNTMFPEMGLAIDDTTGKLNMSAAEMENYINTAIEMQKVKVVQDKLGESVEKLVDAEIAREEASRKYEEVGEELANIEQKRLEANEAAERQMEDAQKAQEAYNEAMRTGSENANELYAETLNQSEAMIEYNGEMMTVSEALRQMEEDEKNLTAAQGEYKESLDAANDSIDAANESMAPYTDYLNGMTDATKNNTDATNANTEAKQTAAGQSQISIETAGQELQAYNNLSQGQQDLAVNVTNAVLTMQENVQSALESQMNMFEEFDGGVQLSTEKMLSNMQSQIDGVTTWEQNLSTLADRGIRDGLLQKLAEMGPQGAGYVQTFANMTDEELKKANELWDQSVDIKGMTNDWGQQLLESGAANVAGGMDKLTPLIKQSGANTVMGLVTGMQQAQKTAEAAGNDLGVKTIESVNDGLGVHSPSTKTLQSGLNTTQGLANGLALGKVTLVIAVMGVATSVITQMNSLLNKNTLVSTGLNTSYGLAAGIRDGKASVVSAIKEVASAAVKAANDELEIHSPSHVFRGMGNNSMDSYALGVRERKTAVKDTVASAVNFRDVNGQIKGSTSAGAAENYQLASVIREALKNVTIKAYLGDREVTRALAGLGVQFSAGI